MPDQIVISIKMKLNLDYLLEKVRPLYHNDAADDSLMDLRVCWHRSGSILISFVCSPSHVVSDPSLVNHSFYVMVHASKKYVIVSIAISTINSNMHLYGVPGNQLYFIAFLLLA
jgi:hypothetical protein